MRKLKTFSASYNSKQCKQLNKSAVHPMQTASKPETTEVWQQRRKLNEKRLKANSKTSVKFNVNLINIEKFKSTFAMSLLLFIVVIMTSQVFNWTTGLLEEPVLVVDVQGEFKYLDKQIIADIVNDSLASGYLKTDLPSLHQQLLQTPWVKKVSLKRKMNSALQIQLTEHQPLAVWNDNALISSQNVLFTPAEMPEQLNIPKLSGYDYLVAVDMYQRVSEKMPENLLPIVLFNVNYDGAISVSTNRDMQLILDVEDWQKQLERFSVLSRQALDQRLVDIQKIDMRYNNGAAVSWREQSIARINQ